MVERSHFAVSHFLGFVVFLQQASLATVKSPVEPSREFGLRLESQRTNLAGRPKPDSSSLGLFLPAAHKEPKVHFSRVSPPATFRLQGLVTLLAIYSLRFRAGFLSRRRRSWDSPFGAFSFRKSSGALPTGRTHLLFLPPVIPPHEAASRPGRAAVPGSNPFGSP